MSLNMKSIIFALLIAVCLYSSVTDATYYPKKPTGFCKPTGCIGRIIVKKGKKYGKITPGRCTGTCGRTSCQGTVRCELKRIQKGSITIISARPSGSCSCGPQPSNFVRTIEEMSMDGPTGDHRVDKLIALNDM